MQHICSLCNLLLLLEVGLHVVGTSYICPLDNLLLLQVGLHVVGLPHPRSHQHDDGEEREGSDAFTHHLNKIPHLHLPVFLHHHGRQRSTHRGLFWTKMTDVNYDKNQISARNKLRINERSAESDGSNRKQDDDHFPLKNEACDESGVDEVGAESFCTEAEASKT